MVSIIESPRTLFPDQHAIQAHWCFRVLCSRGLAQACIDPWAGRRLIVALVVAAGAGVPGCLTIQLPDEDVGAAVQRKW